MEGVVKKLAPHIWHRKNSSELKSHCTPTPARDQVNFKYSDKEKDMTSQTLT